MGSRDERSDARRASLADIEKIREAGELRHDPDAGLGESLVSAFWAESVLSPPQGTAPQSVHPKLDPEVFDFSNFGGSAI